MKYVRRFGLPAAGLLLITGLLWSSYWNTPATGASWPPVVSAKTPDACTTETAEHVPMTDPRKFGCRQMLSFLTDPKKPQWVLWKTKCDLFLQDNCDTPVDPGANAVRRFRALRNSRFPRQLDSDSIPTETTSITNGTTQTSTSQRTLPNLAAVFFNDKAAESLPKSSQDLVQLVNDLKSGKTPVMKPNSIIAKAIWGVYPLTADGKSIDTSATLMASTMTNDQEEHLTQQASPAALDILQSDSLDENARTKNWIFSDHPPHFPGSFDPHAFDSECKKRPFPDNCSYSFFLTKDQVTSLNASLKALDPNVSANSACLPNRQCLIVLVGIHFMIRIDKDDPLRKTNPSLIGSPWIFMTFWWTGHDNGMGLPGPWKYYQMKVTQDYRTDPNNPESPQPPNIVFNPYLEGLQTNGPVANCVSCHMYAAYSKVGDGSLVGCGSSPKFGAKPLVTLAPNRQDNDPLAKDPCKVHIANNTADDTTYFQNVTKTDFVWSFSGVKLPTPPAR